MLAWRWELTTGVGWTLTVRCWLGGVNLQLGWGGHSLLDVGLEVGTYNWGEVDTHY